MHKCVRLCVCTQSCSQVFVDAGTIWSAHPCTEASQFVSGGEEEPLVYSVLQMHLFLRNLEKALHLGDVSCNIHSI